MAQVLVRDLDPAVVEGLKERARRHRRSLQGELKTILEEAAMADTVDFRIRLDRLRETFAGRSFSDSAELIRADRER
jgi:hypothetical protein